MLDILVIGQGLAGSVMAYTLIKRGCKVMVINNAERPSASSVAAGLYNPITGRKMNKTWMADQLFPFLEHFYTQTAEDTQVQTLYPLPIYRPFVSIEEQNDWMGKTSNNDYDLFVEKVAQKNSFGEHVHDPFGGLLLSHCGYLDTEAFTSAIRKWLQEQQAYMEDTFDYEQLTVKKTTARYKNLCAKTVIFCDGPGAIHNPYFNWLPFSPVKGEILFIEPEEDFKVIYNRGVFVLPAQRQCKVGSTYHHQDLSFEPTEAAREQLCEKLNILLKTRYKIVGQVAGVRPATKDRRPFLGIHPTLKPLAIFNGLGTKGVSLAPYMAHRLADFLLEGEDLLTEVDISRYFPLYHRAIG